MTKRGVILCVVSILLLGYLVAALIYTSQLAAADNYKSLEINIKDVESAGFVHEKDIDYELGGLSRRIARLPKDSVNTQAIEQRILQMDKIEDANCVVLNNGVVRLDVTPLEPVARVFDTYNDTNYYVNRAGKRMSASTRYRVDVPVVIGRFHDKCSPMVALPVIEYANQHPEWQTYASCYHVNDRGDIVIVPIVKGHVVNFGDSADIASKFQRLSVFYREVMPVKGWEYYDTISVKWRGQIVARQHVHRKAESIQIDDLEEYIDDPETMQDGLAGT